MGRWLLTGMIAIFSAFAAAQGFPERPVRIIVPLTPGGSPDTIARALAQNLQGVWPHPVVVENHPAERRMLNPLARPGKQRARPERAELAVG